MKPSGVDARKEAHLATRYTLTACLGFATDAALLKGLMHLGMPSPAARCISLFAAMQVTFWVNGLFVFRCIHRQSVGSQWLKYMGTNGVGNLCNYLVFVGLVASRQPVVSNHWVALAIGSLLAWAINYTCTRCLVFHGRDAPLKSGGLPGDLPLSAGADI